MRLKMRLAIAMGLVALSVPALGQSTGKAQVFSSSDIHVQMAQLTEQAKAKGSSGATLGSYGSHAIQLSARTASGGAEIHAHFDDVMLVTEGSATLVTGGTVVDGHTNSDGETRGTRIQDGVSQTVSAGDVIHVPAGTPHQLLISPGTPYSALVIKVKE
jgi:mannose-6-phosphate isomerase-like protein (cupin superfamily)